MIRRLRTTAPDCPSWCVLRHRGRASEHDRVHVGGALLVRSSVLRLCAGEDGAPYVLLGPLELTLHEAEAMIAALTQLVDEGRASLLTQQAERAFAILDAELAQDGGHVDPDGRG